MGSSSSTEDKATGAFCLVTLFKSVPGLGRPKENFDAAWQTIVKEAVNVIVRPADGSRRQIKDDWKIAGGFAPFEKNGRKGSCVLFTASGFGKMVNLLILTNTQAYEPAVTAFFESISFKKPAGASQPPIGAAQTGQGISASADGTEEQF